MMHDSAHQIRTRNGKRGSRGFTLMESMLAVVIVGVGTLGMLQLLASGTLANADASELTTGLTLANNIKEMMQTSSKMGFAESATATTWGMETGENAATADDLDDFDNYTFSQAVDARRQAITYLSNWTQTIKVETVDSSNLSSVIPHGTMTPDQRPCSKITVTVSHNGNQVCQIDWVATYTP